MTAEEIYFNHEPEMGYKRDAWMDVESIAIAAIQEALNVGTDEHVQLSLDAQNEIGELRTRLAELEKENKELREKRIPLPSVEGYLEGKVIEYIPLTCKQFVTAYDALTALRALKEDCEGEKWISVEDRLPTEEDADEDKSVNILVKGNIQTHRRIAHYKDVRRGFKITHWSRSLPLPNPPKQ